MTQIEGHESAWQRWGVRLLPALTFLLGLALAGFVVAARGPGGAGEALGSEPSPSPSASGSPSTSSDTVVTVPGACQDAAAKITEATRLIDEVVGAVRDFQPQKLVDLLYRLEDLDAEIRPLAAECSAVDVSASSEPSAGDDASPDATPSGSAEATPSGSAEATPSGSGEATTSGSAEATPSESAEATPSE